MFCDVFMWWWPVLKALCAPKSPLCEWSWYLLLIECNFKFKGLQCTSYVMKMEMSIPKYRSIVSAAKETVFALGVLVVGVIAFFAGRWRHIQWTITAVAVASACYMWSVICFPVYYALLHASSSLIWLATSIINI